MTTIGEYRTLLNKTALAINHIGATEEWKKNFWEKIREVDVAIMEDFQLCTQESALLADDVKLETGAQEAFDDLCSFLQNNRTKFLGSLL